MYKLLLATDQHDIQNMFSQITDWESRGFRVPRTAVSAQEAIACLEKHHVDAVAYRLNAQDENELYQKLKQSYPDLPIFRLDRNVSEQMTVLNELRVLLNRTHADFANEDYGIADMMKLCRNDFMRALLSGSVSDSRDIQSKIRLLRYGIDLDKPCVLLDMDLPQGDEYLAGRWHYGSERLEVALRNFFGAASDGLSYHVAVVSPQLLRLLACPLEGQHETEGEDSLTGMVENHVQDAIEQIGEYLALEVRIKSTRVLKNVTVLAVQP